GFCEQRQRLRRRHPQRAKGATVADNAVRDCAITRKVGEESFLKQNRQGVVDIRGERLPPEYLEDFRGFERGSEEGREKTEPFFNLRLDLFAQACEPRIVIAWRLSAVQSRFHILFIAYMDWRKIRLCNIAKRRGKFQTESEILPTPPASRPAQT